MRDRGGRGRWLSGIAASLIAAVACTSPRGTDCDVPKDLEPFGTSTRELASSVLGFPAWAADDARERGDLLAEWGGGFLENRGTELERTAAHARSLASLPARDLRDHGGSLIDYLDRQGGRVGQDTRCFAARAWHTIKLVIE